MVEQHYLIPEANFEDDAKHTLVTDTGRNCTAVFKKEKSLFAHTCTLGEGRLGISIPEVLKPQSSIPMNLVKIQNVQNLIKNGEHELLPKWSVQKNLMLDRIPAYERLFRSTSIFVWEDFVVLDNSTVINFLLGEQNFCDYSGGEGGAKLKSGRYTKIGSLDFYTFVIEQKEIFEPGGTGYLDDEDPISIYDKILYFVYDGENWKQLYEKSYHCLYLEKRQK